MPRRPSTPKDFRDANESVLRTGPILDLTVRIQRLDPRDFLELGIIPGMIQEEDSDRRAEIVRETIDRDEKLQVRMFNRILTTGIVEPEVVEEAVDIRHPDRQICIEDLGVDASYFADEILILSGLRRKRKFGPFRRWIARNFTRRRRPEIRRPTVRSPGSRSRSVRGSGDRLRDLETTDEGGG